MEAFEIKFAKTISREKGQTLHQFAQDFNVSTAQLLSLHEKTIPLYKEVLATHWSQLPV